MKTALIRFLPIAAMFAVISMGYSAFIFLSLPKPPKASDIKEIKFNRSDTSINHSETVILSREEFLRFFEEGVFWNDETSQDKVYKSGDFKKPLNEQGGWIHCSGVFATKDGYVFTFKRPRVGVLEISDAEYRSGFLVLPEYK